MRITVDITHPAHFHFFKHAIAFWIERGDDVQILGRDKDLTLQLLDESGWPYTCLTRARGGLAGLAIELAQHSYGVWRALRRQRSQVVVAIAGTFITPGAKLQGIPSLVFYDTEHARLSNRITYPLATRIFTPRAYSDDLGAKQERYDGYHELAYLHPNRFQPDPTKLAVEGLGVGDPFTFVRLVSWQSHHDVGDYGVTDPYTMVERLRKYGRVLISSESALPDDLQQYAVKGAVGDVHHVVAHARLLFGESATMASEAAQLGVPAIFLSSSSRGYTDELQSRYKMVFNFNGENALQARALDCAEKLLADANSPDLFRMRHQTMMADQTDVTRFIIDRVDAYARRD